MHYRTSITIVFFTLSVITGFSAFSQEGKPQIPDAVKKGEVWIGKWSGSMTMNMDGKTYKPQATWTFRKVAGGFGILLEEVAKDPKLGEMLSTDLMGYDPYDQKIHVYTVDNMGTCHEHLCEWKNPGMFYLEHNSTRDGKTFTEKIDMVMKGNDSFESHYTSYLDGKESGSGTGMFKRVK
jgi:hypothetical protein